MENIYKEVDFKTYCKTCEHKDLEEKFDPCNDCLAEPMNANSDKPIYWKEHHDAPLWISRTKELRTLK